MATAKTPKHYPSWRFNPTQPGRIVQNAEEDAALKAEDSDWRDTPYSPEEIAATTGRGVPGKEVPELTVEPESIPGLQGGPRPEDWKPPVVIDAGGSASTPAPETESDDDAADDDDSEVEPLDLTNEQQIEIHETKATDLVESLSTLEDVKRLRLIRKAEKANPKGARKTVLDAVKKRLAALK